MKITYDAHPPRPETGLAPWIRRGLLLWLVAVSVEYLFLEDPLRNLAELEGIAQISPVRIVLVATAVGAVLFLLRKWLTAGIERMTLAVVYTALSMMALMASFTWPFFFACLLVQIPVRCGGGGIFCTGWPLDSLPGVQLLHAYL